VGEKPASSLVITEFAPKATVFYIDSSGDHHLI